MEYKNYLAHYGVPGMKWGVRRYVDSNGKVTQAGKEHYGYKNDRTGNFIGIKKALSRKDVSPFDRLIGSAKTKIGNAVKRQMSRKKNPSKMTDQELDDQIKRLRKEKELKQLRDEANGVKPNNGNNGNNGNNKGQNAYTLKSAFNKIFVSTAIDAATNMAKKQWNLKFNEMSREGKERAAKAAELAKEAAQKIVDKQAFEAFKTTLPTTRSASSLKKNAARITVDDLSRVKDTVGQRAWDAIANTRPTRSVSSEKIDVGDLIYSARKRRFSGD